METLEKTFGTTLKDLLEKHEIKQKDIARECGFSTSSLNKLLNGISEGEFGKVLELVRKIIVLERHLQEEKVMLCYIQVVQNSSNLKSAMEYCDTHDMLETLEMLCKRADLKADHKNKLKDYTVMYRLNLERKSQESNEIVSNELFNKVVSRNNRVEEMKIFQEIVEMVIHHQEGNLHKIIDLVPKLEVQLNQSKSNLKQSLQMRVNQILQATYLRNICDFEKARELAREALDNSIGKRFDAASYVNLGDSYIHDEDPTQAIRYFEKSIEIYKEIGLDFAADWMLEKIEFISILRGKKYDFIKHDRNIALNYILDGQKESGLKILDELDTTPKTLYIRGVATEEPIYFWRSLERYMHRGDRLYGLFCVQELKRLGEREEVIDMFYNGNLRGVRKE